jgi:hypothetical protein
LEALAGITYAIVTPKHVPWPVLRMAQQILKVRAKALQVIHEFCHE